MKTTKKLIYSLAIAAPLFGASLSAQTTDVVKEPAVEKKSIITIDENSLDFSEKKFGQRVRVIDVKDGIAAIEIDEEALPWLTLLMHKDFKRCGGFVLHEDIDDALNTLNAQDEKSMAQFSRFVGYEINQADSVKSAISTVKADGIYQMITKLSSFQNRYYKGEHGKASAQYIHDTWKSIIAGRTDAKVELFNHSQWDQPSVILTIEGASSETIIVGGHQDSISGYFSGPKVRAPGADDNASGIATVTEIARVLVSQSYKPQKTIKLMAYAAEEVGLLGSKEIAKTFKDRGVNVVGVMQLDMVNYKGSQAFDVVLMNDYTNAEQNKFIGSLIDTYLPGIKWAYDSCGYACSDHASWHMQGFPASVPFESKMREMNGRIHTANDLVSVSGDNADHAAKFAKLGLSFIIELDR
ncbi:MAG: M20/M25/M40 family metallo-hydrolase [Bacteriovoracaceae bacterium]|nr:M20/M25/M40 family metallo-hydrolase [Bacteriovoracaceae bacterium]